jgi:hypothetical protein
VTTRARLSVLAGCVAVALLTLLYVARHAAPPAPAGAVGSVFLGPRPGEEVAAYLGRLPPTLPPAGTSAPALVTFATERPVAAAAVAPPVEAVFRVDLPRVQTALRFEPLEDGVPVAAALDNARRRAAADAAADAARGTGRPAAVATAEAAALGSPTCACVVAVVVVADGAALRALATTPGVRAVEAAPPGTTRAELALSPLLPEQTVRADPLPDDGPVP